MVFSSETDLMMVLYLKIGSTTADSLTTLVSKTGSTLGSILVETTMLINAVNVKTELRSAVHHCHVGELLFSLCASSLPLCDALCGKLGYP